MATIPIVLRSGGPVLRARTAGAALSWRSGVAGSPSSSAYAGSHPSDIAGLLGWWDASSSAQFVSIGGSTNPGYYVASGSLLNKVSGGAGMQLPTSSSNGAEGLTNAIAIPRLVGIEGGLGAELTATNSRVPAIDDRVNPSVGGIAIGRDAARTLHLVFSRPNQAPIPGFDKSVLTAASTMLAIGGAPVLTLTNIAAVGSNDTLALFSTNLSTTISARFTHSLTLRWAANGGIDAWIDDVQVATGVANAIPSGATTINLNLGACGLFFHEMDVWDHALSPADMATLLTSSTSVSKRWSRGVRTASNLIGFGQSNADFFSSDANSQLQESIRYHLSSLSVNISGVYPGATPLYDGTYLTGPGSGLAQSAWTIAGQGVSVDNLLTGLGADLATICGIWCYYTENDSTRNYSEKAIYEAALLYFANHVRATAGKTAAQMPLFGISAMPFGGAVGNSAAGGQTGGMQCVREAVADLAAAPANHVVVCLPNTSAVWGRGGVAPDGAGGDALHLDSADNLRHGYLAGPVIAAAIAAAGGADAGYSVPAGLPTAGGPHMVSAHVASSTTILVTVAHDAGTDIRLPLRAAQGVGFAVLDGFASVTSPGSMILATAAVRQSATTFLITLASAMANAPASCRLFYPWGNEKVGRGSAVTDNYSSVSRPSGCDIAADLGASWAPDYPLAVPAYGLVLS